MKKLQKTVKRPVELEGVGLFSGKRVTLRFLPAKAGSGIVFKRVDLPTAPLVPANFENVLCKFRRIAVIKDGVEIETIEHLMAAIYGLEVDNLLIEINSPEVPVGDGSSKPFTDLLRNAGVVEQDQPKKIISLAEPLSVIEDNVSLIALPSEGGLLISFTIDYENTLIGTQHCTWSLNELNFASELSPARTFCLKSDADSILKQGLGKGGDYQNTIVVDSDRIIDNKLRFKDEFVRHKILDLLGDLSLLGGYLKAHIIAIRSGHAANIKLVKKIAKSVEEPSGFPKKIKEPLLDVTGIHQILPHRYPMLLIDKVVELEGYKKAVGIKNVTINEPFFQGHFPGQPVMPGVLQIEAMAQLAGALLLRKEDTSKKVPVLLSLDDVRLRKTVVPGDQLRIEAEVIKIRQRTGEVKTTATVDGQIVASAYMKFMLIDKE